MLKSEIRKEILREKQKLERLKSYKFFEENLQEQQLKHITIIKIKIKKLEEELRSENE